MQILGNDDLETFFDAEGPILIYGAGINGRWLGRYMLESGFGFDGYIDQGADVGKSCHFLGKPVIHPSKIREYRENLRIIIAANYVEEILDILKTQGSFLEQITCLVPVSGQFKTGQMTFHINRLLAFFRSRLIHVPTPTLICNNCYAGHMYALLGIRRISPTINNVIFKEDFMKLCKDTKRYLSQDIVFSHWSIDGGHSIPVGKLDDIYIHFVHDSDEDTPIARWNNFRRRIDWNHIVYIWSDLQYSISYEDAAAFSSLPEKTLLLLSRNMYDGLPASDGNRVVYLRKRYLESQDYAVEEGFDVLGWVNGL